MPLCGYGGEKENVAAMEWMRGGCSPLQIFPGWMVSALVMFEIDEGRKGG